MGNIRKPTKKSAPAKSQPVAQSSMPTAAEAAVWPKDELPFIRQIHLHPFDDDPRLIFADWLEERGDVRAELIRVQCELAQMRARDPRFSILTARAEAIIEKLRVEGELHYPDLPATRWGIDSSIWSFDGNGERHHCSRGCHEAVNPKSVGGFIERAELIVDELGFHELEIEPVTKRDAPALAKVPQLARINALVLDGNDLAPLLASPLLGPLWRLDIKEPERLGSSLQTFLDGPNSGNLSWLRFRTDERPKDLRAVLEWKGIGQLDTFGLIPDAWGEALAMIASSNMQPSRFQFSTPNFSPAEVIEHAGKLSKSLAMSELVALRVKNLPENMQFGRFPLPPKVVSLTLSGVIRDSDVAEIARSDAFRQLKHLTIEGDFSTRLRDPAALALTRAGGLAGLESLALPNSLITDKGAQAVIQSEALAGLTRLNLKGSQVGVEMKPGLRKAFRGRLEI